MTLREVSVIVQREMTKAARANLVAGRQGCTQIGLNNSTEKMIDRWGEAKAARACGHSPKRVDINTVTVKHIRSFTTGGTSQPDMACFSTSGWSPCLAIA